LTYDPGAVIETVGAWLSTLMFVWIAGALALPAVSVAIARRSYGPSPSGAVFQLEPVDVQLLASSVTTLPTSAPEAGLFHVAVGAVRSIVHARLGGAGSVLPAGSIARTS